MNTPIPTATTIQPPIASGGGVMGTAPNSQMGNQMNPGAMPQESTIGTPTTPPTGLPNTPEQVTVGGGGSSGGRIIYFLIIYGS